MTLAYCRYYTNKMKFDSKKMIDNLYKSGEILEAIYQLKYAYIQSNYPEKSHREIIKKIHEDMLQRKETQWKKQQDSLEHS